MRCWSRRRCARRACWPSRRRACSRRRCRTSIPSTGWSARPCPAEPRPRAEVMSLLHANVQDRVQRTRRADHVAALPGRPGHREGGAARAVVRGAGQAAAAAGIVAGLARLSSSLRHRSGRSRVSSGRRRIRVWTGRCECVHGTAAAYTEIAAGPAGLIRQHCEETPHEPETSGRQSAAQCSHRGTCARRRGHGHQSRRHDLRRRLRRARARCAGRR